MLSFTDFKISLGIQSDDKNAEYAHQLRSIIRELFTIYGIALDKDESTKTETINISEFDTEYSLEYKNIKSLSIDTFTENVDYTLDKDNGTITLLSSGNMLLNTDYEVNYTYYIFVNESNQIQLFKTLDENENKYRIDIKPFEVISVQQVGTTLEKDVDYYILGNNLYLTNLSSLDFTKPLIINLKAGYDETPYDLKSAFYELVDYRMRRKELNADMIASTRDSEGNSTNYRKSGTPKHLKDIFMSYMGRGLAFS